MREFSPKQVALAIGVSEASLKRWCDRGAMPSIRTVGGHRRITVSGVIEFLRASGHGVARPELLGLPAKLVMDGVSITAAIPRISIVLGRGDEEAMRQLGVELYLAGHSVREICDSLLAPAIHVMGALWQHGEFEVYQERRGCEIVSRLLTELRNLLPPAQSGAPTALGGGLEGDLYTLPNMMIEGVLREAGWRAESLGAGLPVATMCRAIRDKRPRLLWVSVSAITSPTEFLSNWEQVHGACVECGAALMVGGRGLTEELRQAMSFSAYGDNLRHLVEFARAVAAGAVGGARDFSST